MVYGSRLTLGISMPRAPRHLTAGFALAAAFLASPAARAESCDAAEVAAPDPLERRDPVLQAEFEAGLRFGGVQQALAEKKLAVSLVDLTHPGVQYYAGVNDDFMLYAASLPKIGILLAVIEAVERGDVAWDENFRFRLGKMITISDNADATWAAKLVGLPYIAEIVRDPRYCLYEPEVGGLWVGRAFEKGGSSYRDPLKGISHGASARQTARFYVLLDDEELVTPHWSRRMRALMAPPEYVHKFVLALRDRPRAEFVARKSGTWEDYHADSAIVQHGHRRYVLVGLAHHPDGEEMLQEIAVIADDVVAAGRHRRWQYGGVRP